MYIFIYNKCRMAIARGVLSYNLGRQGIYEYPKMLTSSSALFKNTEKTTTLDDVHSTEEKMKHNIHEIEEELVNTTLYFNQNDIQEKFIRGSGPGGQKINKTNNCVELRHKSTGIIIRCQETRSLEKNRQIARVRLLDRLKFIFTPDESSIQKKIDEKQRKKTDAVRKRKLKEEAIKNHIKSW